jgi:ABC-2 type transport system ATP-binding protein
MTLALLVSKLVVDRGNTRAVNDVSFSVNPGEVLALLGPNGAGKSSTVESLEGYITPQAGQISVLGFDPLKDRKALSPLIGVMLQRGGIYPSLNPQQALSLFASYYSTPRRPAELLERLGLQDVAQTPWRRLSGGEQQRTSLALALIGQPRVLFLDEPTAGVDIHGRLAIREVISEQAAGGVGILLTTHELAEAEAVADRVAIMSKGQLAKVGSISDLITPGLRFSSKASLPLDALQATLGASVHEGPPGRYRVEAPSSPALIGALSAWLASNQATLLELSAAGSLEELYLSIVGHEADDSDISSHRRRTPR